jgi:hypothetical protein
MAQLLTSLTDLQSLGGVGLTGQSLTNLPELAMRLGYSSLVIWGLQSAGVDQQLEGFLSQWIPEAPALAVSTATVAGASDILGAEIRRVIGY